MLASNLFPARADVKAYVEVCVQLVDEQAYLLDPGRIRSGYFKGGRREQSSESLRE